MGIVEQLGAPKPAYAPPQPITEQHLLDGFACSKESLNGWLREHALANEGNASRTYVVTAKTGAEANSALAFYTLAYGSVALKEVPRKYRQGLPNPVPVMVLGRLAVDRQHEGRGLGPALLREAFQRTLDAWQVAGLRAMIVHAIDDDAVSFYAKYGFQIFPAGTRTMFLPIETIRQSLAQAEGTATLGALNRMHPSLNRVEVKPRPARRLN